MKPLLQTGLALAIAIAGVATASAQGAPGTHTTVLHTNEADIEEATQASTLAIADPLAVFAFVLGRLPERVKVMPTENYYYFRFTHNGVPYAGNIRLAMADRDQGKVHFAYGDQPADWRTQFDVQHVVLDAAKGITVEKVGNLIYRVGHGGKSVTFALNDLSQVKPPADLLGPDETFLGPVFDESAMRFFLVFNAPMKVFHYILDETGKVPDEFVAAKAVDRILIGKRTGFAFYRDDRQRKILIGVNERASQLNTAFDGPFDQLPENFIEGDTLRDAILTVDPSLKDKIDRLGNFADGRERSMIHPYLLYRRESDLTVFHRCMTHPRVPAAIRARCFVIGEDELQNRNPMPLAMRRR